MKRRVMVVVQYFHEDKLGGFRRPANFLRDNDQWKFAIPSHRTDGAWAQRRGGWEEVEPIGVTGEGANRSLMLGWLDYLRAYRRVLRTAEPPISAIHVFSPPSWWGWPMAILAAWKRIPCIVDFGDSASSQSKGILSRIVHEFTQRNLGRLCHAVTVAAPGLKNHGGMTVLTGVARDFFRIGEERESRPPRDEIRLIYCGSFGKLQALDRLLRSWPEVIRRVPNARLELIGRGAENEEDELRELARELGILDSVEFDDIVPPEEIPRRLARADWGLVSLDDRDDLSYAVPTKLLEYFAAGLPVIGIGGRQVAAMLKRLRAGAWISHDMLRSEQSSHAIAGALSQPTREMSANARRYARDILSQEIYRSRINEILAMHARPWSITVDRLLEWIERHAIVEIGDGLAVRHSIAPSRIPGGDEWLYPEVSGYAVSLYLLLHRVTGDEAWRDKARRIGHWLLSIQDDRGRFPFVVYIKDSRKLGPHYSFDAAMIVRGLTMLYRSTTDSIWRIAAEKTGAWLTGRMQFPDGSFAAAEDEAGNRVDIPPCHYADHGVLHGKLLMALRDLGEPAAPAYSKLRDWTLSMQRADGAFPMYRDSPAVFSHTHLYALEGLFGDPECRPAVIRGLEYTAEMALEDGGWAMRSIGGDSDAIGAGDASAQALRLLSLAHRAHAKPEELFRKASAAIARSLRKAQYASGAIPEIRDAPRGAGPSAWPSILTAAALLHWEREEAGPDFLF